MSETFRHPKGHSVAVFPVMPRRDSWCSVCGHAPTGLTCVQVQNVEGGPFALFCRSCVDMLGRVVASQPEAPADKPTRVMTL